MEYIELGDTGVEIPRVGLGTWAYRGGVEPLLKGIALGANLIDTAEAYGTEGAVGKAVRDIRDEVLLATKVSPAHFKYDDVLKAADGSLKELGTDRIDLYQLHWPSPAIPLGETMGAMDRLVEEGKVRYIGVSNFSVAQLQEAQDATANRIVANQVRYSLVDRDIERDLLPYCQATDVTVIAYSPLAQGIAKIRAALGDGRLERVAESTGRTEAQVALNWSISRENVMAIPKSDSIERTEENCNAAGWKLSLEDVGLLEGARGG